MDAEKPRTRRPGGKAASKPLGGPEPGPGVERAGPRRHLRHPERHGGRNLRDTPTSGRGTERSEAAAWPHYCGQGRAAWVGSRAPSSLQCTGQGMTGWHPAPRAGSSHHGLPGAAPGSLAPLSMGVTPWGEPAQATAMSALSRPFPEVMSLSPPPAPSS